MFYVGFVAGLFVGWFVHVIIWAISDSNENKN